jgi:hypothetical protein
MKNYLKKIFLIFSHGTIKKNKAPLTVLSIWKIELIILGILFFVIISADIWIYKNMANNEIQISDDKVGTIEILNKNNIIANGETIQKHENSLNNPSFPLTGSPF